MAAKTTNKAEAAKLRKRAASLRRQEKAAKKQQKQTSDDRARTSVAEAKNAINRVVSGDTARDRPPILDTAVELMKVGRGKGGVEELARRLHDLIAERVHDGSMASINLYERRQNVLDRRARDRAICAFLAMTETPNWRQGHITEPNMPVVLSAVLCEQIIAALRDAGYSRIGKANPTADNAALGGDDVALAS